MFNNFSIVLNRKHIVIGHCTKFFNTNYYFIFESDGRFIYCDDDAMTLGAEVSDNDTAPRNGVDEILDQTCYETGHHGMKLKSRFGGLVSLLRRSGA